MGRKSSISRLPDQVRAYIEGRLADGRMTLDELIADLQAQFPSQAEAGELPSRAAVHRYGQKLERRLAAIRASTEAAKLIRAQAGDDLDASQRGADGDDPVRAVRVDHLFAGGW
ncbi:DUF3486 family protein [Pseudomonas aeruginosa]|nr:DUF3486 family protein [Pseudomonas aeruginosa]